MQGQAVITETLLRAQEQQQQVAVDQPDVGGGAEVLDGEGSQRPSTASSNDSEPFEVIDANSVGEYEWHQILYSSEVRPFSTRLSLLCFESNIRVQTVAILLDLII